MLQRSDARWNLHFKPLSALRKKYLALALDLVDKIAVQSPATVLVRLSTGVSAMGRDMLGHDRPCRMRGSRQVFRLISILVSGLFVGLAARYLYPGAVPMGLGRTILLGIAGSLVAGLAAGWGSKDGSKISRAGCLASILGAMVLIFIGRHL